MSYGGPRGDCTGATAQGHEALDIKTSHGGSGAQARADRAEKCGESATTLAPHTSISAASNSGGQSVAKG